jgi:hypothetical protein
MAREPQPSSLPLCGANSIEICYFTYYLFTTNSLSSIIVSAVIKRKTSFEVDVAKVQAAKGVLGTKTLTDTVDAALSEVIKLQQRRRLLKLLSTPGALELDDPEVMSGAWR